MSNNQYEWFKGPRENGKKSDWKANAKVTWKFTRLFLFFSLFFFSMWGCVQTFTNKTSITVGQGVEITTDRNRISPQVTNLDITADTKNGLYAFVASNANIVLYDEEHKVFQDMRQSYNDKMGRTFYLDEALGGGNSVIRLGTKTVDKNVTKNNKYLTRNPNENTAKDDSLLVATSVFDKSANKINISQDYVDGKNGKGAIDYLSNFEYFVGKYAKDKHYVKITDPNKLISASKPYTKLYLRVTDGIIVNKGGKNIISLSTVTSDPVGQYIPNNATSITAISAKDLSEYDIAKKTVNLWNGVGTNLTPIKLDDWNQVYNLNLMSYILNDYDQTFKNTTSGITPYQNLKNQPWGTGNSVTIKNTPGSPDTIKNISSNLAGVDLLNQQLFPLVFDLNKGVKTLDYTKSPADFAKQLKFANKYAFYNPSHYKPISSWGQAWDMDRGAGPFYGLFVYPIAWLTDQLTQAFPFLHGWESLLSIIFVVVIISMITFLLSFKGTLQQQRMTELNSKKAIIESKYENYKGNKQMENRKRQEVSELYKKAGINPLASMSTIFITMPFFLAMWRTIGTNQHIKATVWLGINFSKTSYKELFSGSFVYLPLLMLAGGTNILSQMYPKWLTRRRDKNRINVHQKAAMKKSNKTQNIMMFAFTFITLIFSAGLQVYFIVRSVWRIGESTLTHKILKRQKRKRIEMRK